MTVNATEVSLLEANLEERRANHAKIMAKIDHLEKLRREMGMSELDEDHVIACVHHLKAGMLKRIFRVSDTFQ